ncbi:hypothetical protein C2845_PM01G45010 [Panicum miliaceum]|uniref:Uncharacterized protein n=1 Tax=Panicum miliaceum TaxID=4540 RepID=A0A3L6TSD7_PANMI|nr:hypothetical protein C2845_PM01G45010 [Panicum miliaceum]
MGLGAAAAGYASLPQQPAGLLRATPPLRASAMAVRPRRVRALLLMPRAHPPAVRETTATTPATPQLVGKDAGNHARSNVSRNNDFRGVTVQS